MTHAWPVDIRLSKDKRTLTILYDTRETRTYSAELLRIESPSAEARGHSGSLKQKPANKQNVTITAIEPVGNYAIRLSFDDGHDTGLYSWSYLYSLDMTQNDAGSTSSARRV